MSLLGFYYFSELSNDDVAFLQGISGYGSSIDDTNDILGVSLDYKYKAFSLFGQYIRGQDGRLDRHGWYIQPSYQFKFPERKRLNTLEVLLRYGGLDVDIARDPTDSLTWDRNQTTLAVIIDIIKNTKLKLEYYINDEHTGGKRIDNNEFLT